jgi:hypothetical protein
MTRPEEAWPHDGSTSETAPDRRGGRDTRPEAPWVRGAPGVRDEQQRGLKHEAAHDDRDLRVPSRPRGRRLGRWREATQGLELELQGALLFVEQALTLLEPVEATKGIHQSCSAARSASACTALEASIERVHAPVRPKTKTTIHHAWSTAGGRGRREASCRSSTAATSLSRSARRFLTSVSRASTRAKIHAASDISLTLARRHEA